VRLIKIGLGNANGIVGAVGTNTDQLIELAHAMARDDVTIGCLPEQAVGGYPAEDLVQWRAFVADQRRQVERFANETAGLGLVLVVGLTVPVGGQLFNVAAVVHRGRLLGFVPKEKLPTYNVFYERRVFSRASPGLMLDADGIPLGDYIFSFDFGELAVEVCEDIWSPDGPLRRRCYAGAEIVINISASPYRVGVAATRKEMIATRAADSQALVAYVNKVGAQDGLIFDGGGYVFQNGRLMLDGPRFREGFSATVVDLDRTRRLRSENTTWRTDCEAFQRAGVTVRTIPSGQAGPDRSRLAFPAPSGGSFFLPAAGTTTSNPRDEALDELYEALALGVADYFVKSGAFSRFGVALSGGRDSLLTLLVAWRAIQRLRGADEGPRLTTAVGELLTVFYMPSRHSGDDTRRAAETICREIGAELRVAPIDEAFDAERDVTRAMLEGGTVTPTTLQNIQARIRGQRMWNWANSADALFLQTSDMSEKAVGYTTVGGDLEGALSVIANVPKTVVVALLERLRARFGFKGISATLETVPGPELAGAQKAEDELMPFDVLDACLHLHADEKLAASEIAEVLPTLFPDVPADELRAHVERFVRLFSRSIYKWVQSPLALHVGTLDLDRERALQLPIVQRNEWHGREED